MSNPDDSQPPNADAIDSSLLFPMASTAGGGFHLPLLNLSMVRSRMDYVQRFLSDSINSKTIIGEEQMDMVSKEITDAIHQVIVNGAALISCSDPPKAAAGNPNVSPSLTLKGESDRGLNDSKDNVDLGPPKVEAVDEEIRDDLDIVELDAVELLAEHLHFCDFCGKGFKRDANLRMHMRAHGNKFKTPEALAKREKSATESTRGGRMTRFSCPFAGCNRNKLHKKFRPLKSVICVKNHFKRSHCPKMYSCNRCNKKNFSVLADLKSHLKHCGETKWKCSCGTSFSRKDKLFGHMILFDGHMPAVAEDDEKLKELAPMVEVVEDEEDEENKLVKGMELEENGADSGFFDGLLDEFGSIDDFSIQDLLGSSPDGSINWNL